MLVRVASADMHVVHGARTVNMYTCMHLCDGRVLVCQRTHEFIHRCMDDPYMNACVRTGARVCSQAVVQTTISVQARVRCFLLHRCFELDRLPSQWR
jgi:hypothetical protein